MVIVIAITAIVAGAVAVFISRPIEGYADAVRRAELTDAADTALRRMSRDLRTALPNSVRIFPAPGNVFYLEFLQTSAGGRYRSEVDNAGLGNILKFHEVDSDFDVIGAMPTLAAGHSIVIYNLNNTGNVANAYFGDNREAYASTAGSILNLAAAKQFPFSSPGKRFQVVDYAVTYVCDPGTRELRRYWNYGIHAAQPTPPVTANTVLLASEVTACNFTYDAGTARTGVVMLDMTIARNNEPIRLYQQVHVNNVP
jgi:MSHA biogenesis protein MshO